MSTVEISLRLSGQLPATDMLNYQLGNLPTQARRRGEPISKRRVQPVDLWLLQLAKWDSDDSIDAIDANLQQVAVQLSSMAQALATLDRRTCQADLYISTVREEDQGGLGLPVDLVMAAAAARLSLQFSILVMLEEDATELPHGDRDSLVVRV